MIRLQDTETERVGDTETPNKAARRSSPCLPLSPSPSLPKSRSKLPKLPSKSEPLTTAEKRLFLARLVRADSDCLDDSGGLDITRARLLLSSGAVQQLTIDEVEDPHRSGKIRIRRKITLRLVDRFRALKLDDALETSERRARTEAEEQRAKAEQAAQESQARAAAYKQYDDIDKEVERRVWTAIHRLFQDHTVRSLPGLTIETLNDALKHVSRHPRPPPKAP